MAFRVVKARRGYFDGLFPGRLSVGLIAAAVPEWSDWVWSENESYALAICSFCPGPPD